LLNVTPGQAQLGPSDHCAFFVDIPSFSLWVI
jgi:hypothetical protein